MFITGSGVMVFQKSTLCRYLYFRVQFFPLPADSELVKLFQIVCMTHLIFNLRYNDVTSVNPRAWNLEAWFSFATFASNLELEQVADLLMKMLQLCHVEPTPELRGGLRSCK